MQLSLLRLAVLATVWGMPVTMQAQFRWTTNNGTITITGYTGPGGVVAIPASTNGLPVTGIGDGAFFDWPGLTSITIPDGVISIGAWAFEHCPDLTSVALPESVITIGDYAFGYCTGLTNLAIPNTVTNIGNNAFTYCSGLAGVTIPESVATIGDSAFAHCTNLTNVAIPTNVTTIGDSTFAYCSGLAGVAIPGSVTNIGASGFAHCTALANVAIPNSVTTIGDSALAYCRGLTNVALPNSVTSIGNYAFSSCGLTNVTLSTNLASIGSFAFDGCSGLISFAVPASVTNIGAEAFYLCTNLSAITVDARNSFYSSAGAVLFNQGWTTLICCPGGQAGTYTVPNGVTSIAPWAFAGCGKLAGVTLPGGVSSIGDDAFYGCSSLTNVTIPSGVSNIAPSAFAGCGKLGGVAIPDTVTSIGADAFYGCSSLASVTIPSSVTSVGSYAFASNSVLGLIYFLGNAPAADSSVFYADYSFPTYSPPVVCRLWGTTGWQTVFAGLSTAFWDPVSQLRFTTSNGAITITGYGGSGGAVTLPASLDGEPVVSIGDSAFSDCGVLTDLTIGNGVTNIGQSAFGGCTNLASVTMGNSVTSIGDSAFSGCNGLTNVTMGGSVANIRSRAFEGCSSLASVTIPNTVSSLGMYAFGGCSSLTSVTVPDGVTSIADYAFINCLSLADVTLGNGVTSIGQYAFCDCRRLTGMTIPSSVTSIGKNAFLVSGLTSIAIPSSVTSIGDDAFSACFKLTGVYFQGTAPSLGSGVFDNDNEATTVYYLPCSSGWSSTYGGLPAVELNWIAFTASPTYATFAQLPLTVNFTSPAIDNCGEKITGWHWSFGDGSSSTAQNPAHTYITYGTFAPSLRATNSAGVLVVGAGPPVTVSPPSVALTANPTDGTVPLTVSFASAGVDNGGNAVTNWNWSFGDGSTSTAQNPSHTYASKGTFSPVLISANDLGDAVTGSGPGSIVALWGGSTVGFTANPIFGTVPATVSFASPGVDSLGNAITNWNWSFGDGSASAAQNPSHTYTTIGDFAPSILATNNAGVLVVGVGPSVNVFWPSVAWTINPTFGTVPLTVSFTSAGVDNRGNAVTNWNWSFGDGSTSTAQNPTHTYTTAGDFDPALTATNNIGVMVIAGLGSVEVLPAGNVGFTANPTSGVVPLTVSFAAEGLDSNGDAVIHWDWSFGDGSASTAQNPSHTYTATGTFSVVLIATNNLGGRVAGPGPVSVTVTAVPPPSNLVTNGGFETGDFTGWTLSGVDLGDNYVDDGTNSGILPHSGGYLAALGSAGTPSYLSQTLSTVAGVFYSLSLWLDSPDGQGPNEFLVSWNGTTLFDEMNVPAVGWTNLQFLASATGASTVLEFGFRDDDSFLGLDDISVLPAPAPGPVGIAHVRVQTNRFGFVITGSSNLVVVVEASAKLANPAWHPVQTITLTGGSFYFSDPGWTNYPSRFYRVRGP